MATAFRTPGPALRPGCCSSARIGGCASALAGACTGGVSEACPGRGQGGARRALSGARGRACCIAAAAAPLGSSLPTMAAPTPSGGGGGGSGGGGGTPGPIGPPAPGHPAVSSMQGKDGGRAETTGPLARRSAEPRPVSRRVPGAV